MSESPQPEAARLRASDADRDRVAGELREALAEGRLTPDEHAERIDTVYAAKTYAELTPVLDDLPTAERPGPAGPGIAGVPEIAVSAGSAAPASPRSGSDAIVAIFSGATRRGRWLVGVDTDITAVFGGADLDLRQAVLADREVRINVTALFGGVQIKVPPGVRVTSSISAIFGGAETPPDDTDDPGAPLIRLTGMAMFGGVEVKRTDSEKSGGSWHRYRDRLRERRRERRQLHRHRDPIR